MSAGYGIRRRLLGLTAGARARKRRSGERADPNAEVHVVYLTELYSSPRYDPLPLDTRAEQLQLVVLHYMEHVQARGWRPGAAVPAPAFVRRGRVVARPAVRVIASASAAVGDALPSRRHEGDTPAVLLQPGAAEAEERVRPRQVAHDALFVEACAHLDTLLSQYENKEEASERLFAEMRLLVSASARDHAKLNDKLDIEDASGWASLAQVVLRSPHLHNQLVAATDAVEAVATALNSRMPGDEFGDEHKLTMLGGVVIQEAPEVATMLQMTWCRPPTKEHPLGKIWRHVPKYKASGKV